MTVSRLTTIKSLVYSAWAVVFFTFSLLTIYFVYHVFAEGVVHFSWEILSVKLVLSLLLLLAAYFLADASRLYSVLNAMGYRVPLFEILRLVFINIFISNVTPMATGGGFAQVYFLNKLGVPIGVATAATSMRTVIAALFIFTLAPLFIWLNPDQFRIFSHANLLYFIPAVSVVYMSVIWALVFKVAFVERSLVAIIDFGERRKWLSRQRTLTLKSALNTEIKAFSSGLRTYFSGQKLWVFMSILFTFVFLFCLFSFSVVLIRAMHYDTPILHVFSYQTVVTFFTYFAPTPGGTGVAEGGYGLLFAQMVDAQDLVVLTIMWRSLTIYVGVFIGIFFFYRRVLAIKRGQVNGKKD